MRISKKSEYALRALLALAREPGAVHTIPSISRREAIPAKFLEQILLSLRHAGFLQSRRGAGGGYSLMKGSDQITVFDVVEAVDGYSNQYAKNITQSSAAGSVGLYLKDLEQKIRHLLESNSIEDLLKMEQRAGAGNFEI